MSTEEITLFDLPSKAPNKCWSYNPYKTRMTLNYKGLDYKTEWIEYPDIEPRFKDLIPPNESGAAYTIPTVRFADGSYMQDSRKIIEKIEQLHPSPSLHLDSPYLSRVEEISKRLVNARPEYVPKIMKRILNPASIPHWEKTRLPLFTKPIDLVEKEDGGQKVYKACESIITEIGAMLRENPDGPFFEGARVTYADFVWVAILRFFERIGDDTFEGMIAPDREIHVGLLEACRPWLKRDDY